MERTDRLRGSQPRSTNGINKISTTLPPLIAALLFAGGARGQQIPSPTPGFDILGFIQAATLEPANASPSMCPTVTDPLLKGGTVTVNGITMTVPCNTILQMPANTLPWALLFPTPQPDGTVASFSAPIGTSTVGLNGRNVTVVGQSGLALADTDTGTATGQQTPFPSFEVRVVGNIVNGKYIVGLIAPVSQQGLNAGSGVINCIDYANSYILVGGDPTLPCYVNGQPNGFRLQINDPLGRWGIKHSPDPRFSGDTSNTTVHAASGYPMCVPRTDPAVQDDPVCPKRNRPLNDGRFGPVDPFLAANVPAKIFTMPPPPPEADPFSPPLGNPDPLADPTSPDPRQQAPFMVGDFINYSGTLAKDALGNQYMSVHTLDANLGIFTSPGTRPAYVNVETILLGTGGNVVNTIIQEATTRIFVVGFTTDPNALIDVTANDVNPCTGAGFDGTQTAATASRLRLLGTVDPLTQPVPARFRFHVLGGDFMPPTREMVMLSHDGQTDATEPYDPTMPAMPIGVANGLGSGFYLLPNFDFIFPENHRLGDPIIPNNFQDMPFLSQGSGPLFGVDGNTIVGQLIPWPGDPTPAGVVCSAAGGFAPVISAGIDFAVNPGGPPLESLAGTLKQDPNAGFATITWQQTAGPNALLTPTSGSLTPTFSIGNAPAGTVFSFQLTVSDNFGTSTDSVNVTVLPVTDSIAAGVTARWRAPIGGIHKVGVKGGQLRVTITDTVTDPTIRVFVIGWGEAQVSAVVGLPTYTFRQDGVSFPPDTVLVRTSRGSEETVPVQIR